MTIPSDTVDADVCDFPRSVAHPHFGQTTASSRICAPQVEQYFDP